MLRVPAAYVDPAGRPVDYRLLTQFLGAVLDDCGTCAGALLALLAEDAVTVARLVELACISIREHFGGLPETLINTELPSALSVEFRALAHAGTDGTDHANSALFDRCARMSPTGRHAAATSATNLFIGHLAADI